MPAWAWALVGLAIYLAVMLPLACLLGMYLAFCARLDSAEVWAPAHELREEPTPTSDEHAGTTRPEADAA